MNDSRMDRAIARLVGDRELEASILFPEKPDFATEGFLTHNTDMRARIVRFIMQNVFENPIPLVFSTESLLVGIDSLDRKYYVLQDPGLDIGCWRQISPFGTMELVATDTTTLSSIELLLRTGMSELPDRTKNVCVYCRKKGTDLITCIGCQVGAAHSFCFTPIPHIAWACSDACKDLSLANRLGSFIAVIEPLQKAAMRKRRRMAHEISNLGGGTSSVEGSKRVSRSGRVSGTVDYSFREFDEAISSAIRKSERNDIQLVFQPEPSRTLSREERMALRYQNEAEQHVFMDELSEDPVLPDSLEEANHYVEDVHVLDQSDHLGTDMRDEDAPILEAPSQEQLANVHISDIPI